MTDFLPERAATAAVVPVPRCAATVREATMDDFAFIDELQKMHSHMVGWFPRRQMESYIERGNVLIAEGDVNEHEPCASVSGAGPLPHGRGPLGYIIYRDQYMRRDDVGIIYQLNVKPMMQRNLIGAMLVKGAFERAAYGCRLFSCWCAQDIQANYFWESVGFVPLAFRTGSRSRQRIHIFWQRRVREDDAVTPYWFPSQTSGGAVAEDRLVLPIPPGTHWRDAKPLVLPGMAEERARREQEEKELEAAEAKELEAAEEKAAQSPAKGSGRGPAALPAAVPGEHPGGLPGERSGGLPGGVEERERKALAYRMAVVRSQSRHLKGTPPGKVAIVTGSGLRYVDRPDYPPAPPPGPPLPPDPPGMAPEEMAQLEAAGEAAGGDGGTKKEKKRAKKPRAKKAKHDPKWVQAARELRDRFLEQVNDPAGERLLPCAWGKWDVSRAVAGRSEQAARERMTTARGDGDDCDDGVRIVEDRRLLPPGGADAA